MSDNHKLLQAMKEFGDLAAALAGMKKQLIDGGFSPEIAEQIVLETIRTQPASGGPTQ